MADVVEGALVQGGVRMNLQFIHIKLMLCTSELIVIEQGAVATNNPMGHQLLYLASLLLEMHSRISPD